jgi:metallo-beta-lactamase class B
MTARTLPMLFLALACANGPAAAQAPDDPGVGGVRRIAKGFARSQLEGAFRSMNRPFTPLKVIGDVYYVGASDVTSFLIVTPEGHILVDTGFASTVPMIRENVRALGFKVEDVKLIVNTHAHVDHAGGHAAMKRLTNARIVMSRADSAVLARGGKGDVLPVDDPVVEYEPVSADRLVDDGDVVRLGGVTLTAHLTPGHTRGATTWTTTVVENGRTLHVVFYSGTTVLPGVALVDNAAYPTIAEDFAASFRKLKALPCDVFLAPHGSMFGLGEKAAKARATPAPARNPFIDPEGYRDWIAKSEQAFRSRRENAERRRTEAPARENAK